MPRRSLPAVALVLLLGACADRAASIGQPTPEPIPTEASIACEQDGGTTVETPHVLAQPDGIHLIVKSHLDEPASLNGLGMDVEPGRSRWILSIAPGDIDVACWPFSRHGTGPEPPTQPLQVWDLDALYVPPPTLECESWSAHGDYATPTSGEADDPVEAARRTLSGISEGDVLEVRVSGYPEAANEGQATVVVSRADRLIAIVGATLADDGRWFAPSASACIDSGLDFA